MSVSASPAQDDVWREATDACERVGHGDRWRPLTRDEVAGYARSPVFRAGAFMPGAGTVQPAALARGLRRVALERGVVIHERTRVERFEAGRVDDDLRRGRRHRPRRPGRRRAERLGRSLAAVRAAVRHVVQLRRR